MRKLAHGQILAKRLPPLDWHPWLDACRERMVALVADEGAYNNEIAADLEPWEFNRWRPDWDAAEQLAKFPATGARADFEIASAYDLRDCDEWPEKALAVKVEKVSRTGSWKTCEDYWLVVRPDGSFIEAGSLDYAARLLHARLEKEREAAKALRLDMAALDDL